MSDMDKHLKSQRMASLANDQRVDSLQAQLEGAQKRARELKERVIELEGIIKSKDDEIQIFRSEINKQRCALEQASKELKEIKGEKMPSYIIEKRNEPDIYKHEKTEQLLHDTREKLKRLSKVVTESINSDTVSVNMIRDAVIEHGDLQYRVLNIIIEKKSVKLDEIASITTTDNREIYEIIDNLSNLGEVEIRDSNTVVIAEKYHKSVINTDNWKDMKISDIFDSLQELIRMSESNKEIANAIEKVVDIVEQTASGAGALVFEMRKTSGIWKNKFGDVEDLIYKIKEWKSRVS